VIFFIADNFNDLLEIDLMTFYFLMSCNLMEQKCICKMSYATEYIKSNQSVKTNQFDFIRKEVRFLANQLK